MSNQSIDRRAVCLYIFSFITISLVTGLVYGWPALRRNLISTAETAVVSDESSSSSSPPPLSEESLGLIFTVGSWSTQGGRFFFGILRDRRGGTRLTTLLSLVATTIGSLGIAFSSSTNVPMLAVSMFLVGLGSGTQLCLQPVASLFDDKRQGTVLASFSGAFQVSGLVFMVLTAIADDRRWSFGVFAMVLMILSVVAAYVLPKGQFVDLIELVEDEKNFKGADMEGGEVNTWKDKTDYVEQSSTSPDDTTTSILNENDTQTNIGESNIIPDANNDEDCGNSTKNLDTPSDISNKKDTADCNTDIITTEVRNPTAFEQMKTVEYVLLLSWFSTLIIPMQYYIAALGYQLEQKGDDDGLYTNLFSIFYSSAAILSPMIGYVADKAGVGVCQGMGTVMVAASLAILAVDELKMQIFGMIMYGIGRMAVFGMFFGNVGKRFGYVNYGVLAGSGLLTSAITSLLQYPVIAVATTGGRGKETNIICAIVVGCLLPYCIWLGMRERRERYNEK